MVGHGPKGSRPAGRLPVFTVSNEKEAKALITLACETTLDGEFVARELVDDQTPENLTIFGDRLADLYERFVKPKEVSDG